MRLYKRATGSLEFIQIYGERNSGTTYLAKLLQDNLKTPSHVLGLAESDETPLGNKIFGYKHWFLNWDKLKDPRQAETLFIVIYRNPYTWVRAMMDRPYALERSLTGKAIADLPDTLLAGHINGKDTQNEFDPETGEQLTLFELRQKKLRCLEQLKDHVDNVVYLPLEELLADPAAVMAELAVTFQDTFRVPLDTDRAPFRELLKEYRAPHLFNRRAHAVLDAHIDWATELAVGYHLGSYSRNARKTATVAILHGASCSGKSSIMSDLAQDGDRVVGIEMDDCSFWEDRQPDLSVATLQRLVPSATDRDVEYLAAALAERPLETRLCTEFLLTKLAELDVFNGPDRNTPDLIVFTGGALPNPPLPGDASVYRWLTDRLPLTFRHILVDLPEDVHLARINRRKRGHLAPEILHMQAKKRAKRDRFDTVVTDLNSAARSIGRFAGRPALPGRGTPASYRAPRVRARSGGLKYIQIYGERNSGTKYLTRLISEVARDPDAVLGAYASKSDPVNKAKLIGYKHYYPRLEKIAKVQTETLFLVIYKNPYTWIRSMLSKPYHFAKDLDGKAITDLPEVKLHGVDVHGREIPDVHPHSGEPLTLFELRKHKIQAWEALAYQVQNVAYINYEDALAMPSETLQQVIDAYPSLFVDRHAPPHVPNPKYLEKYLRPEAFGAEEIAVMDKHIDWSLEKLAGYAQGNLFVAD